MSMKQQNIAFQALAIRNSRIYYISYTVNKLEIAKYNTPYTQNEKQAAESNITCTKNEKETA